MTVSMRNLNLRVGFRLSAGVILAITGCAKIMSALGDGLILQLHDPVLGIPFGQLMAVVGCSELLIAAVCLLRRWPNVGVALVAWLSTTFLMYRVGLWSVHWKRPCPCLGHLMDALRISPEAADWIAKTLLAYLLVGSFAVLLWPTLRKATDIATDKTQNFYADANQT